MSTYHKIQSLYKRDDNGRFVYEFSRPEFGQLADCVWRWTEKIEGMNMRAIWTRGAGFEFRGRTDRAQIPGDLMQVMGESFNNEMMAGYPEWAQEVVFYGEGFGGSIQKGKHEYGPEKRFCLFDITVNGRFQPWDDVVWFGETWGIPVAREVGLGTLWAAENMVRSGFGSVFGGQAEGLVLRPRVELYNVYGERVITKMKTRDFR